MQPEPRHAVLTGGTGYLGKHLLAALLRGGWQVTALVRGPTPRERLRAALAPFALPEAACAAPALRVLEADLTDRAGGVRDKIAPEKCSAGRWLDIMEEAHRAGLKTTATMMYGHVETPEDVIAHLLALRAVQDRTGGFSSFIPWSFKPGNSTLGKRIKVAAHPLRYLRLLAVARLVLDNIPHIQSSWFSEDLRTGQLGLLAGADDFGGLLFEENVLGKAGHAPKTSLARTLQVIREMGFEPAQRNSLYEVIERFDTAAAA